MRYDWFRFWQMVLDEFDFTSSFRYDTYNFIVMTYSIDKEEMHYYSNRDLVKSGYARQKKCDVWAVHLIKFLKNF